MTGVACSNCGRPICPDDMHPAAVGIHCPICAGKMREGPFGKTSYRVRARAERLPFARALAGAQVTSVLLAANVTVFVLMLATGQPTSARTLLRFGALPRALPADEWWRLASAMFVHIGIAHLVLNMFALMLFGGAIEQRYGRARFLALYVASGVLGSAASLAFNDAALAAGASGAIFGIMGAWFVLVLLHRNLPAFRGQLQSWLFLIGFNIVIGMTARNIDLVAHLGGLAGGAIIGACLELSVRVKPRAQRAIAGMLGYLIVAIAAYGLAAPNVV